MNEFIREKGNLDTEPIVKPKDELIKIFGDPKDPNDAARRSLAQVQRPTKVIVGSDGRELTEREILRVKDHYR